MKVWKRLLAALRVRWPGSRVGTGFDFMHNDAVNLRAGLLLVPMGFINEMHEPVTYFGTHRPEVEQRIIPTTWRATRSRCPADALGSSSRWAIGAGKASTSWRKAAI